MVETDHKYVKDLVWKKVFKSGFHFHVVSIFTLFQFDFSFNFKLPKWPRWVLRGDSLPGDRKSYENIKIKIFMFNASAKFQSAMGALQLTLLDNYQHCIQMSLPYPSCEWYIACPSCVVSCCDFGGFGGWILVERFAIKHFCSGFLDAKMATKLKIYFLFGWSIGCVRGLWQQEGCFEKRVRAETV